MRFVHLTHNLEIKIKNKDKEFGLFQHVHFYVSQLKSTRWHQIHISEGHKLDWLGHVPDVRYLFLATKQIVFCPTVQQKMTLSAVMFCILVCFCELYMYTDWLFVYVSCLGFLNAFDAHTHTHTIQCNSPYKSHTPDSFAETFLSSTVIKKMRVKRRQNQ